MDIVAALAQLEQDMRSGLKNLDEYADRIATIRAAVGGEAVAWQFRSKLLTGAGWSDWSECSAGDADYYSRKGAAVQVRQLCTSPTATVDVGALRNLIDEMQALADRNTALGMPVFSSAYVISKLAALIGEKEDKNFRTTTTFGELLEKLP